MEISALVTGQVKVDIRTRGGTPQTRSMSLEPSGAPTKRSATSKDGDSPYVPRRLSRFSEDGFDGCGSNAVLLGNAHMV